MFVSLLFGPVLLTAAMVVSKEPECFSRYDWDYKMLTQIVKIEQDVKTLTTVIASLENEVKQVDNKHDQSDAEQKQVLTEMKNRYTKLEQIVADQKQNMDAINQRITELEEKTVEQQEKLVEGMLKSQEEFARKISTGGYTYTRWGRTACPDNRTEMVYSGYVGGSHYTNTGAAANPLCLPSDPIWGIYDDSMRNSAPVYGSEYEISGSDSERMFKKNLGEHDVPCAVCRSPRPSAVMIPARNACYPGWTVEYTGYLAAGHRSQVAASEFVCLDADPEVVPDSSANNNGWLLYVAEASCGSLKCPPYVNGRELTCVICSK